MVVGTAVAAVARWTVVGHLTVVHRHSSVASVDLELAAAVCHAQ